MADIFPIVRTVVERGHDYVKRLESGEHVKCRFCGNTIRLSNETVHLAEDGMQMVQCPYCWRKVSVLYFFDETLEKQKKLPYYAEYHGRTKRHYEHAEKDKIVED